MVEGELHLTLTGWDRRDYSLIARKPEVVVLQMANPDVDDATLRHLTGLTRLRELDLNGCARVTDDGLKVLGGLPRLERLRLRGTGLSEQGFRETVGRIDTLTQLDLRETRVSPESVVAWRAAGRNDVTRDGHHFKSRGDVAPPERRVATRHSITHPSCDADTFPL